jgi:hypothetical protein
VSQILPREAEKVIQCEPSRIYLVVVQLVPPLLSICPGPRELHRFFKFSSEVLVEGAKLINCVRPSHRPICMFCASCRPNGLTEFGRIWANDTRSWRETLRPGVARIRVSHWTWGQQVSAYVLKITWRVTSHKTVVYKITWRVTSHKTVVYKITWRVTSHKTVVYKITWRVTSHKTVVYKITWRVTSHNTVVLREM